MTRFVGHVCNESTSDLACGHYDPLAAMRTVTGVSFPESCRPHTGTHSCAARRSGGAASKKKLKRDKIPLQSSINFCLFFSEMKPNRNQNEGRKGYNVDIALRSGATADVQGAPAGAIPAGLAHSHPRPPRCVTVIDGDGFSTVVRRSKRLAVAETEDRDLQPESPPQKENGHSARFSLPLEAFPVECHDEDPSLSGDLERTAFPGFPPLARTKQTARVGTGKDQKKKKDDASSGGGAAEDQLQVDSDSSSSKDSHIVKKKGTSLKSLAKKKGPARMVPIRKTQSTVVTETAKTKTPHSGGECASQDKADEAAPPTTNVPMNPDTPSPLLHGKRREFEQERTLFPNVLRLHASTIDGSCMPHSLLASLQTRERLSGWQLSTPLPEDDYAMRQMLCDYADLHRNIPLTTMHGTTPEEAVVADYIEGNACIVDPAYEAMLMRKRQPFAPQRVRTWEQYISAMRQPHASMDEIMAQICAVIFDVRIIILGQRSRRQETGVRWAIQHDIHPNGVPPDRCILLVHSPGHYEWAHPNSFRCSNYECGSSCQLYFTAMLDTVLPQWEGGLPLPMCTPAPHMQAKRALDSLLEYEDYAVALQLELQEDGHTVSLEDVVAALWLTRNTDATPNIARARRHLPGADQNPVELPETPPEGETRGLGGKRAAANAEKRKSRNRSNGDESDGSACKRVSFNDNSSSSDEGDVSRAHSHAPPASSHAQAAPTSTSAPQGQEIPHAHWHQANLRRVKHITALHEQQAYPKTAPNTKGQMDMTLRVADELQTINASVATIQQITGCSEEAARRELTLQLDATPSFQEAISRACGRLHPAALRTTFVEQELGEGVRAATVRELATAHIPAAQEEPLRPTNLQDFYTRTTKELENPEIQNLPAKRRLELAHRRADTSLHNDAIASATWKRDYLTPPNTISSELDGEQLKLRPKPVSSASSHPSPAVRIAHVRQEAAAAASPGGNSLASGSVVVVGAGSRNLPLWLPGAESDGKGFNYTTKQAMVHHWRQYMAAEGTYAPRSFKSMISPTMIPTICAETGIHTKDWEHVSDVTLLEKIEECLAPRNATDFIVRLRGIKMEMDPTIGTLSQRYRLFAEQFLLRLAEGQEAGSDVSEHAIKMTFLAAIRSEVILDTWTQERRWTNVMDAHRNIIQHLKDYDTYAVYHTLSGQQRATHAPAANAPLQQQQPQQQPQQQQQQQQGPPPPQNGNLQQGPGGAQQQRGAQQHYGGAQQQYGGQQQGGQQQQPRNDRRGGYPRPAPDYQQQQQQAHALVNAMQQAFPHLAQTHQQQQPAPAPAAALPAQHSQINYAEQRQSYNQAPPNPPAPAHPGLDARGPRWHRCSEFVPCRNQPCTQKFCQIDGNHGHDTSECWKLNDTRYAHLINRAGYWSDNKPNDAPITLASINPRAPGQSNTGGGAAQPPRRTNYPTPHFVNSTGAQTDNPRIPPPPPRDGAPSSTASRTPHNNDRNTGGGSQ